jgi:hypothetical protein
MLPETEARVGATNERVVADRGFRRQNAPQAHQFRTFISGQRRRMTERPKASNASDKVIPRSERSSPFSG